MTRLVSVPVTRWGFAYSAALLLMFVVVIPNVAKAEEVSASEQFLAAHFTENGRMPQMLWVTGALREQAETLLGHRFPPLRVRYWLENNTSGWILDEIGKELPITIGVIVNNGQIEEVRILNYRESRGGEVRYGFFTDQFKSLSLANDTDDDQAKLNRSIDGITGATLSVTAVRKIATLALLFHQHAQLTSTP